MSITNTHNKYRAIIMPLITLWLLCQSMVLCAGGMTGHGAHQEMGNNANAVHHDHSQMQHAIDTAGVMQSAELEHNMAAHHHEANQVQSSNVSQDSCCEQHESYVPNIPISIFVALIVFFFIARLTDLVRSKSKQSHYLEAPPPRYTYPQNYVLHCAYLN